MVKLFVGNLADSVDSSRLRNLFLQYVQVQECDVVNNKNFAFVHVVSDEDAELCMQKLHKTMLEGRELHLERSTSKLRKEPGMSDKCFTCGATDHKTPNCPQELIRRQKRSLEGDILLGGPEGKKPALLPTINLAAASSVPSLMQSSISNWGCKVGGGNDADPELPCPTNPELRTLYDQYMEARTKYFFYRERLSKELALQPPVQAPMHLRYDMTRGQQMIPQMMGKPQNSTAPALNYSAPPTNYQSIPQSAYASSPLYSVPASAYASRPSIQNYATTTSISQSIPGQQQTLAPSAPYNTVRHSSSVNYATFANPSPQPPTAPQNGQPSAPYSSNAPYRNPPYASSVHSYNTIPAGPPR